MGAYQLFISIYETTNKEKKSQRLSQFMFEQWFFFKLQFYRIPFSLHFVFLSKCVYMISSSFLKDTRIIWNDSYITIHQS